MIDALVGERRDPVRAVGEVAGEETVLGQPELVEAGRFGPPRVRRDVAGGNCAGTLRPIRARDMTASLVLPGAVALPSPG